MTDVACLRWIWERLLHLLIYTSWASLVLIRNPVHLAEDAPRRSILLHRQAALKSGRQFPRPVIENVFKRNIRAILQKTINQRSWINPPLLPSARCKVVLNVVLKQANQHSWLVKVFFQLFSRITRLKPRTESHSQCIVAVLSNLYFYLFFGLISFVEFLPVVLSMVTTCFLEAGSRLKERLNTLAAQLLQIFCMDGKGNVEVFNLVVLVVIDIVWYKAKIRPI